MEGPIFGRTYVRREICVSKSIELAGEGSLPFFFLFYFVFEGNFQVEARGGGGGGGGLYLEGRFNGGFLSYESGGPIYGGAYFRNFTVCGLLDISLHSTLGYRHEDNVRNTSADRGKSNTFLLGPLGRFP